MKLSELKKPILLTFSVVVALLLLLFVIEAITVPMRGYIVAFLSDKMMNMDAVAGETFDNLVKITKIALWMALVIVSVRFLNRLIFGSVFRQQRGSQTSTLLRNVFSITLYLISFFVIFKSQYPSVDLAALFTTSAILGVILGLALQDTLGNLFAGLSLQADQPFQVGDVVNIPNKGAGVIENITWRGVKIRTFQNKLLIISNSILGKESIEVAPRDNLNARIVYFSTLSTDSPTRTIHVVREAVREAENVSAKLKPIVRIKDFTDHGVDWEIKYWLDDYSKYNDTDALIRQRIWYAFLRENINFASQSQTIYLKRRQPPKVKKEDETYKVFERLSAIEIFEPLSDEETMQLARQTSRRVFAPGEIIIRAGEEGETMFVINRGSVKIQLPVASDGNGQSTTLATLHEGRFFGEMALLTGEPRSATVVAVEESEVFEIGHNAVKSLFEVNPYLAESLSEAIAERRALLDASAETKHEIKEQHRAGVFAGIKRFFGLS